MCHSIVQVKSTMGQGFLLEYPETANWREHNPSSEGFMTLWCA